MKGDVAWRNTLTVARDVYGKHPSQLTQEEILGLADFMALALIEQEELDIGNR